MKHTLRPAGSWTNSNESGPGFYFKSPYKWKSDKNIGYYGGDIAWRKAGHQVCVRNPWSWWRNIFGYYKPVERCYTVGGGSTTQLDSRFRNTQPGLAQLKAMQSGTDSTNMSKQPAMSFNTDGYQKYGASRNEQRAFPGHTSYYRDYGYEHYHAQDIPGEDLKSIAIPNDPQKWVPYYLKLYQGDPTVAGLVYHNKRLWVKPVKGWWPRAKTLNLKSKAAPFPDQLSDKSAFSGTWIKSSLVKGVPNIQYKNFSSPEGNSQTLSCSAGQKIHISSAKYVANNPAQRCAGIPSSRMRGVVQNQVGNRSSWTIPRSKNQMAGDPCYGVVKKLVGQYYCA